MTVIKADDNDKDNQGLLQSLQSAFITVIIVKFFWK